MFPRSCRIAVGLLCMVAALSCSAPQTLSYYVAAAPGDWPDDGSPASERSGECDWMTSFVEIFPGMRYRVRHVREPLWEVEFDEIESATIYDADPTPAAVGSHEYVMVEIKVAEGALDPIDWENDIACGSFVVVRTGDRDLDFAALPRVGSEILPGGAFATREEAERFYRGIRGPVSFVAMSPERRASWLRHNRDSVDLVVWYAKCDPDYLRDLGEGYLEAILAMPDIETRMKRMDCGAPPEITRVHE